MVAGLPDGVWREVLPATVGAGLVRVQDCQGGARQVSGILHRAVESALPPLDCGTSIRFLDFPVTETEKFLSPF